MVLRFFCLLDLTLSSKDMSWTKSVFGCLFRDVVWSIIAPLSKEYEPTWLASVRPERLCSDRVGITLLGFISFKFGSIPEYLKEP